MTLLYVIILGMLLALCPFSETTEYPIITVCWVLPRHTIYRVKVTNNGRSRFNFMDWEQYKEVDEDEHTRKDGAQFALQVGKMNENTCNCTGRLPLHRVMKEHNRKNKEWEQTVYCAPGKLCGADLRLYRKKNSEKKGKNVYWSYHASSSEPSDKWEGTNCYVWSVDE